VQNGIDLCDSDSELFITKGDKVSKSDIEISKRIGIKVAAERLWRFHLKEHPHVSDRRTPGQAEIVEEPRRQRMTASPLQTIYFKPAFRWLLVVAWMAVIFAFSNQANSGNLPSMCWAI